MTTDTAESVEARHDVLLQAFGLVKEFPIAGTATLFRKAKRFTAVNDVTPAKRLRSWGSRARASRPSPGSSPGSSTRPPGRSPSTAST